MIGGVEVVRVEWNGRKVDMKINGRRGSTVRGKVEVQVVKIEEN